MQKLFYASSEINRQGDYRNNKKIIEKIMVDKNTKFIPYYIGKNFFKERNQNIEAIKLNKNQLKNFFPKEIDNPIFLGVANDINYVGLDLSNQNLNMELWLKDNEVIFEYLRKYGPSLNDKDGTFIALTAGLCISTTNLQYSCYCE